jgi:(p)ppGpp synthase/HD superfamily hydrolase
VNDSASYDFDDAGAGAGAGAAAAARADIDWSFVDPAYLYSTIHAKMAYLSDLERAEVYAATEMAFHAHDGQKRKSGEPFVTHPVAVAGILADQRMDHETVIAGLLHDTVEDTDHVTFDSIQERFGPAVRRIVEGETKVSKVSTLNPKP